MGSGQVGVGQMGDVVGGRCDRWGVYRWGVGRWGVGRWGMW